jgi:hypothetical protein
MPRVGTVDERFQSFNIEMLEVTGGKFWKPYGSSADAAHQQQQPAGASAAGDTAAGRLTFAPASITFLAISDANNGNCR